MSQRPEANDELLSACNFTPEKLDSYVELCREAGYIPIHPKYLKNPLSSKAFIATWPETNVIPKRNPDNDNSTNDTDAVSDSPSKPKGQNKKRKTNTDAVRRARKSQLCSSFAKTGTCSFTNCESSHDITNQLATVKSITPPPSTQENIVDGIDVSKFSVLNECPAVARGQPCQYGLNCIANPLSHCDPETGKNMFQGESVTMEILAAHGVNSSNSNFIGRVRQEGLNKKLKNLTIKEPRDWNAEVETSDLRKVNERRTRLKDLLKDKLILAPLTTVGNQPFRRLCVSQGCDATNSEMILASSICLLKKAEMAMLRRHPSERLFGVQLASGFPDAIEQAINILNESDITYDWLDLNAGCPIEGMQNRGSGCFLLSKPKKLMHICQTMAAKTKVPVTLKTRLGTIQKDLNTTHTLLHELMAPSNGLSGLVLHGRTAKQRYSRSANWSYIGECKKYVDWLHSQNGEPRDVFPDIVEDYHYPQEDIISPMLIGNGDIVDFEQYNQIKNTVDSVMIGRGALVKPWLFREIKEQRRIDLTAVERLDLLKDLAKFGLETWGSDAQGVENTRRFFLEELSFFHRYVPIGIIEKPHLYSLQSRPPIYVARNELESLLASDRSSDWVRISEMFFGKVDSEFTFLPKHKSASF